MDTATRSTPCLSSVGIRSRRGCMALQQKNHPNERMNTTAVLRDGVAAARHERGEIGHARAVRRARHRHAGERRQGVRGRVRGRELRGRSRARRRPAAAARRGAAGSVVRGGGRGRASARGTQGGARARDTWCSRDGSVLSGAGDEEEGRRRATKKTGTHPERWHEAGAPPGGRRTRSSRRPWRGASVVVSELVERKAQNDLVSRCKKIRRRHITNGHKFKLQNVHMRN